MKIIMVLIFTLCLGCHYDPVYVGESTGEVYGVYDGGENPFYLEVDGIVNNDIDSGYLTDSGDDGYDNDDCFDASSEDSGSFDLDSGFVDASSQDSGYYNLDAGDQTDSAAGVGDASVNLCLRDYDTDSYSEYKVFVCHKGISLYLPKPSIKAHLNHGDCLGLCNE